MQDQNSAEHWTTLLVPIALILGLVLLLSIGVQGGGPSVAPSPLEDWLKMIVGYLAAAAEIAAALVIAVAILRGITLYIWQSFQGAGRHIDFPENIRLRLGRVLALGLEFTVASDILRTAVAPTRQDILNLGAIVMLRSLLNYFLEREIRLGEQRTVQANEEGTRRELTS